MKNPIKFDKEDYLFLIRSRGFTAVDMKGPIAFINGRELIARPRRARYLKGIIEELDCHWKYGVRYIGVLKVAPIEEVWDLKPTDACCGAMYIRAAYYADWGVPGDGSRRYANPPKADLEDVKDRLAIQKAKTEYEKRAKAENDYRVFLLSKYPWMTLEDLKDAEYSRRKLFSALDIPVNYMRHQ